MENAPVENTPSQWAHSRRLRHLSEDDFRYDVERALFTERGENRIALIESRQEEILDYLKKRKTINNFLLAALGVIVSAAGLIPLVKWLIEVIRAK